MEHSGYVLGGTKVDVAFFKMPLAPDKDMPVSFENKVVFFFFKVFKCCSRYVNYISVSAFFKYMSLNPSVYSTLQYGRFKGVI